MRVSIVLMISIFLLVGCKKNKIEELDYTFSDSFAINFSIKYKNGDTIYFRKNFEDLAKNPYKWNENYFAILNSKQKEEFNKHLNSLNIKKYDSIYEQNFVDGVTYKFYFKTNTISKMVFVHSHEAPEELDEFSNWIYNLKKNIKLHKLNKEIDIKSENINYQPIPLR